MCACLVSFSSSAHPVYGLPLCSSCFSLLECAILYIVYEDETRGVIREKKEEERADEDIGDASYYSSPRTDYFFILFLPFPASLLLIFMGWIYRSGIYYLPVTLFSFCRYVVYVQHASSFVSFFFFLLHQLHCIFNLSSNIYLNLIIYNDTIFSVLLSWLLFFCIISLPLLLIFANSHGRYTHIMQWPRPRAFQLED